jgi:hypothetical protein
MRKSWLWENADKLATVATAISPTNVRFGHKQTLRRPV